MNPYEILGVTKEATKSDIKSAYRRASSEAHPDKHGGDGRRQQQVNDAYALLSDPERRRRFDETGSTETGESITEQAKEFLRQELARAIEDPQIQDVAQSIRAAFVRKRQEIAQHQHNAATRQKLLARRRFAFKGPAEDDFLTAVIDQHLHEVSQGIRVLKEAILIVDRAEELFAECRYEEETYAASLYTVGLLGSMRQGGA